MKPTITGKYMIFEMRKPIYGNTYAIRDKFVLQAKRWHKIIRVKSPSGIMTCTPSELIRKSKLIEMYYANPNIPMHLYQFTLVPDKEEPQVIEDYTIPNMVRERMRERAIELGLFTQTKL